MHVMHLYRSVILIHKNIVFKFKFKLFIIYIFKFNK